ncbi:SDR family oxidoreductase [Nocardioides sp. SYSU D00038]|uniref:SDR family NAD(P)-dependent oxidoreductase n=1 Tax=Nocardioides sp. SYSU D00038 TaxID=2812554 RepID=UPI00196882FD|nr:SDR family NAD(P)-dependent oxidoreductase [Nocardioides sp. SYSU D00038]
MSNPPVIVVTGASSGIGRATALHAARDGAHLVLAARGRASLDEVAAECDRLGAASTVVQPTDVGDDDAVARLVARTLEQHRSIDAVVNAAGVVAYGRVEDVPVEVFDGVLRTNLLGSANVARHVVPVLRRQGEGHLVLVGSVIGHIGVPSMTPYAVSKWAVRALARHLDLENRDLPGVHVDYVAPGGVDTPIYTQAANYAGFVGRPPPPVASPERVAGQVLRRLRHPWLPPQLAVTNDVLRLGYTALPWVYVRLIGRAFPIGATDLDRPVEPGPGNVLESRQAGNALRGDPGGALAGIVRNVRRTLQGVTPE